MVKFAFLIVLLAGIDAAGQLMPAPSRDAELQRQREQTQNQVQGQIRGQRIKVVSESRYRGKIVPRAALGDIRELYRVPTRRELRKLQPLSEDLQKYSRFLKQRRTGLIRLELHRGCGDNTQVISASDECLEYPFPGNGSDYSFRERNYRIGRLADLRFGDTGFSSPGVLQLPIFVGLGDIPLESVSLTSPGLRYLTNFSPSVGLVEAASFRRGFESGREVEGYFYAPGVRTVENMTYVLRSIAYEGTAMRAVGGFVFDETDFDERADIVVAFRIVRTHDTGGITILWKELSRKDAPEMQKRRPAGDDQDSNRFTAKTN